MTGDPRATLLLDDLLLTAGPTVVHALRAQVPPHLLDQASATRRYELIFACAWRPGLVVCAHCIPLLKAPTKLADATCDRCGRVCTGPATGDGIHPLVVQIGALTFSAGACRDCRPDHPVHCEQSTTNTTEEMTR